MNLDRDLAYALAAYAKARRGWDEPGTLAQLAKVKGRSADDVAMAWVRLCADDGVRSPGAFPNLAGPHWSEKVAPPATPGPPKPAEACRDCGRHFDACRCDGGPTIRVVVLLPEASPKVARLRALRDEVAADLCSHGVPPGLCVDHRAKRQAIDRISNQQHHHKPETNPTTEGPST